MIPAAVDYVRILPELVLSLFGILVMLVDPILPEQGPKKPLGVIALVGVLAGLGATVYQTGYYGSAFYNTISVDTFSVFFHFVVLLIALVVIWQLDKILSGVLWNGAYPSLYGRIEPRYVTTFLQSLDVIGIIAGAIGAFLVLLKALDLAKDKLTGTPQK